MKFVLLLWGLVLSLYAQVEMTPLSLQLQWKHQFQFAGYYMAKEKGFYREAGLDVDIREYQEGLDIADAVSRGEITFGSGRSSLIMRQEHDLLLLAAIYQSSPFVLHALKRDDIKTLKDIKGKRVMLSNPVADMASITAMLKSEGINTYDFRVIKHFYTPQALIEGKVDFICSYISNEPFVLKEKGIESIIFDPKAYGFDFYGDILYTSKRYANAHPDIVEKFYRATLLGWQYAFDHIDESVEVILQHYNTQHKSKAALLYEGRTLKKLAYKKGVPFGTIEAVRLREIANTYRLLGLDTNLLHDYSAMIYRPKSPYTIALEEREKRFLQKRKKVTLCVNPDWMPLEYMVDGKYIGMGADLAKEIAKMIDTPLEAKACGNFTQRLALLEKGAFDLVSMVPQKGVQEPLAVTDALLNFPLVIATGMDRPYITDLSQIGQMRVAVVKGYGFKERLIKRYGSVDIVEVKNAEEGLRLVDRKAIDAYIGILPSVNYLIRKFYIGNLKINRALDDEVKLGFALSSRESPLFSIVQKAIHALDIQTRDKISRYWMEQGALHEGEIQELWRWMSAIGMVLVFLLYTYFLSIRKNRELKLSIKELEILMESTIEGIIIFDRNGICMRTNRVASALFGYAHGEMVGKHASDFVSEASKKSVRAKMQVVDQAPYEAKVLRKDGTEFDALLKGKNISWKGEKIRVSTVIDISDIKRLQHDLQLLNRVLEEKVRVQVEDIRRKDQMLLHQSKMASMGEMIGAIAHQWRQPLNVLNINIQNLDDDFEDGLIDRDFIDRFIRENSEIIHFMSKTIDDFRNFYRIDKLKECFFVRETIETTTSIQKAQLRHHNIRFAITGEDFCITGYRREFQQVILNLVNNAADAIRRCGRKDGMIEIVLDHERVIVKDNGGGVEADVMERIFEPYFTTKAQGEGTGIGLYMSKVIIEKNMGGKLEVENIDGGAAFTIYLEGLCKLTDTMSGETTQKQCLKVEKRETVSV